MSRFLSGHSVTVSRKKGPRRSEFKEVVGVPSVDDVWSWAVANRKPPPGWRVLGCFLGKQVFVVLRVEDRHDLGFAEKAGLTKEAWNKWLAPLAPLHSSDLVDYFGESYHDDDDK